MNIFGNNWRSNNQTSTFTPEQEEALALAILNEFVAKPPTIGLIGVSGTGKSSTINSMFQNRFAN